tara:strand:+ start:263 stop:514 length:252 start_codon:yes stop_codon:yes gene_type:complete
MKNEYIEVVKRWQAGEVFSIEALKANADAAEAAYVAASAAYAAADVATVAYVYAAYADAEKLVERANAAARSAYVAYEEITNE